MFQCIDQPTWKCLQLNYYICILYWIKIKYSVLSLNNILLLKLNFSFSFTFQNVFYSNICKKIIIINVRSAGASGLIGSGSKIKMHLMIPLFRTEVKGFSISGQFLLTLGSEVRLLTSTALRDMCWWPPLPAYIVMVVPSSSWHQISGLYKLAFSHSWQGRFTKYP